MRRREFLQTATTAGIGAWAGVRFAGREAQAQSLLQAAAVPISDYSGDDYKAPDWLRYSRGVLFDGYSPPIYPHMKNFDARRLLQAVVELGGNFLRFQPIGYLAYYPSNVFPLHDELGGRDLITEVAKECRRTGIHQYCYVGYGVALMLTPDYVKKHPKYGEWLLRNPEGEPYGIMPHYGWTPPPRKLCTTGDAYRAGIRQVVKEICEHDIEGVYFDAPSGFGYTGVCFCNSCRISFRKFSGMDLDLLADHIGPDEQPRSSGDMKTVIAWYAWMNQLTKEDFLDFRKIIHDSGKFMLCHNARSWHGPALPLQYRIPDGFMVEASTQTYDRLMTGMMGASMARPSQKLAQMYMGSYSVTWFGQPPHEQPWVVHNTNLEDGEEIRMEGFANLACGNAPLYGTANRLYFGIGSGSAEPTREVFEFMKRTESILQDSIPVPYVTIVPTWESLQLWRQRGKSWNWPMMCGGMGLAMLDERVSFDVNPSTEMNEEWLQRQKVIALCGASGISDEGAKRLAAWVERGGGLLATYDTGLYDAQGQQRQNGGALQEVLGVKMKGTPLRSQPECYYRVKEKHAALGDYKSGAIIEGDGRLVPVETLNGARTIAECWSLGTGEVRGPAVVVNSYGQGRTIYVSGSLEANYLYDRVQSTAQLIASMVSYLGMRTPMPFKLRAPRGVYGILRQTTGGDLVLWILGNVGFKDADVGRMRQEFMSVSNVEVGIHIREERQVKGMRLLRTNRPIPHKLEAGYATATIPFLHIAEAIHVELA